MHLTSYRTHSSTAIHTDLFLYGYTVYELMTGFWPASQSGRSLWRELVAIVPRNDWSLLEVECVRGIMRVCSNDEYVGTEETKAAVVAFLEGLEWEVERVQCYRSCPLMGAILVHD
jgi:hypothetical protein